MISRLAFILNGLAVFLSAVSPSAAQTPAHAPQGVTVCLTLEPTVLDPTQSAGQVIREVVYANIFEGLTGIDRNGKVVPRLAKSWDISKDGLRYTFYLQDKAVFHDGTPLAAEDVVFSFNRAKAPGNTTVEAWIFAPIKSVSAKDVHTVDIELEKPSGLFLYGLGWGDAVIMSQKSAATNTTKPIGTGPYAFKSWRRGDRLTLQRVSNWWAGTPDIENAVFRFIPDTQAMRTAVETGDCDLVTAFGAPEQVERLKKNPNLQLIIGETEGETILAINNARKPFDDVRVRRAMSFAVDRKAIIDGAMSGIATPIGSHFSPSHPAYVDLTARSSFNLLKAKDLLSDAGYANGFDVTLSVPPMDYARRSAQIVAAQLAKANIRVTLIPLEFPQWLERVYKNKDYDLSIIAHTEPLDIRVYARENYYFQYKSAEFQALINKAFSATDDISRDAALKQAQEKLSDDAVNVFLFELPKIAVARKGLTGAWQNWPMPVTPLAELSWSQ